MKLKRIAFFSAGIISFFAATQSDALFNPYQGQFVSVNAGVSVAHYINLENKYVHGLVNFGGNLFLGEQINHFFGPEIGITYLSWGSLGQAEILVLNGRFTVPVNENFFLIGKLGVGYSEVRTCNGYCIETNDVVPSFGAGLGIAVSRHWMSTLEFNGEYLPDSTNNGNGVAGALTLGMTRFWHS